MNKNVIGRFLIEICFSKLYIRSNLYQNMQTRAQKVYASKRRLEIALTEIKRLVSELKLPKNIVAKTEEIYKKSSEKNLVRGRTINGMVAASLYTACKKLQIPLTFFEIENASKISKREVARNYKIIARGIGLRTIPTEPKNYIQKYCSELKLPKEIYAKAMEFIKKVDSTQTISKKPNGFAAAAIYLASVLEHKPVPQDSLEKISGVSVVTLRTRKKELVKILGIDA